MADSIEQARGFMSRDKESIQEAFRILRDQLLESDLMNSPSDLNNYEAKRKEIVYQLERVRAYIKDVVGY